MTDAGSSGPLRRCRPAMGSFVEVSILDPGTGGDDRPRTDAVADAFAAIDRVASLMSFHDPDSDLSRINRSAFDGPVSVHPWTFEVLSLARDLFIATDGHFDCSVGACLVERGLLPRRGGRMPRSPCEVDGTFADVRLLDSGAVAFDTPLCIDLGGIAKGYAVDRAIDALRARGIGSAVVNAGGDLRVLGSQPVPIHVRRLEPCATVVPVGSLADGAFATSSCFRARAAGPAQSPSALVETTNRRILDDRSIFSVVAPTCAAADALTKALASSGGLSASCRARFDAVSMIH